MGNEKVERRKRGYLSLSDDQLMLFTAQRGLFPRITECTIAGDIDSGFDFGLHQSIDFAVSFSGNFVHFMTG